jgi:hypothetical protein
VPLLLLLLLLLLAAAAAAAARYLLLLLLLRMLLLLPWGFGGGSQLIHGCHKHLEVALVQRVENSTQHAHSQGANSQSGGTRAC